MALTNFANNAHFTAAGSNGTTSPTTGTQETWTAQTWPSGLVASTTAIPATLFHIADPAQPTEIITVTDTTNKYVIRGAEGTTPVAHATGATYYQIITAGDLLAMKQASGAITSPVTLSNSTTEMVVATYQPITGEINAGTTFELIATGTMGTAQTTSIATLTWALKWGGTGGTTILSMVTGTNCPALVSAIATGSSFDVNGTVEFIDTTHAIGNLNFWWQKTTTTYSGVASNGSAITLSGSGPLVLTAKWSLTTTSSVVNVLTAPAPLTYRAA